MDMTKTHEIKARKRDRLGSRYARRVREQGGLPAILYGHGEKPEPLTLDSKEALSHILAGEKVFRVQIEGGPGEQTVLLKDIQFDYLGTNVVHVDFARVDLNEMVEVQLPIHLRGDAKGLEAAGATLLHPTSAISVKCRVTDIMEHFDVDVSDLDVGDALHAGDLKLPAGVELASEPDEVIALIQVRAEEEAEGEAVAVEGEGAEPEVISERKEESKEGEKE